MQTIDPEIRADLHRTNVSTKPEAMFEFDYSLLTDAEIFTPISPDSELFPPESVLEQRYTQTGIPKAIVGGSSVHDQSNHVQYRVISEEDTYKYWVSPTPSEDGFISNAWMEVHYDKPRPVNKLYVAFEVSYAFPDSVDILVRQDGQWVRIFSDIQPDSNGVIEAYVQSSGWIRSLDSLDNFHTIDGVRVEVNSMSQVGVRAHFLSISAKWIADMTERIINMDLNKTMENPTLAAPVGDTSVNEMSLSLENEDGEFSPQDDSAMYHDLKARNVKVSASVQVNDHSDRISQGTFYTESWNGPAPGIEMNVECSDVTRFMQETFLPSFLLVNYRVDEAAREILQRSGFNLDIIDVQQNPVIPYIWYNEQVSVWEALRDLANSSLCYFYINEYDQLVWTDFSALSTKPHSQMLDATHNIIEIEPQFEVLANSVNVEYNVYGYPTDPVTGENITQELWTSTDDEALLSMPIRTTMTPEQDYIPLDVDADTMDLWPETGLVCIQGEYMEYTGKNRSLQRLTGVKRGMWKTPAMTHMTPHLGDRYAMGPLGTQKVTEGNLILKNPSRAKWNDRTFSLFGPTDAEHTVYGTRMRIRGDSGERTAGLVVSFNGTSGAVYLELTATLRAQERNMEEVRAIRNPLSTTSFQTLAAAAYTVAPDVWYDLEITVDYTDTQPRYGFYVNGAHIFDIGGVTTRSASSGRFGVYVRGNSHAEFSHLYFADDADPKISLSAFQDVLSGSSFSSDYIYNADPATKQVNEFAPQVRQVKHYSIDYSVYPALSAAILSTNIWQTRATKFIPGPFGASFYLENTSDRTAVASGTSPNLFDTDMTMTLMAYGLPVVVKSEERKVVKDSLSIRRNGIVELEVSNPWIQTEEMAQNIADIIVRHFGDPVDTITMPIVADHTIQLGDVVDVEYAEYSYFPYSHSYYVLAIDTSWSNGFEQTLTLRRKR